METIEQVRTTVVDLALKFGPKVLAALLILTLGYFVARGISRWLERALGHVEMEPPVRTLIVRIARAAVSILFLIMALQNLGVELLPLIAGLGVAGAGIALAMQGVLGNLFAGLTIILTKPFRIGEYIEIVGEEGAVESISLFQTTLTHPDRSRVIIPNRKIVGEILHNFGRIRQVDIQVGVAYDTDLTRAIAVIQEALRANGRVLRDMEPPIIVGMLADSSVNIAVKPWVAVGDFGAAVSEINQAILAAFRDAGIVIPFPQREIRMLAAA
jgi:small conductance mechanosensitive channel